MSKKLFSGILLVGFLVLAGCASGGGSNLTNNSSDQTSVAIPANAKQVSIQNFAFSPDVLTIKKGGTVVWTNNDSMPHKIKSDKLNSDNLSKGQTYSFTFTETGTYDYICSIHPVMKGKIIVE